MEGGQLEVDVEGDYFPLDGLILLYVFYFNQVQSRIGNLEEMEERLSSKIISHLDSERILLEKPFRA